jgi:hypothetical protein
MFNNFAQRGTEWSEQERTNHSQGQGRQGRRVATVVETNALSAVQPADELRQKKSGTLTYEARNPE